MSKLTSRRSVLRSSAVSATFAWLSTHSDGIKPSPSEGRPAETVDDAVRGEWPLVVPVLIRGTHFEMNIYSPAAWLDIPPDDRADYTEDRVDSFDQQWAYYNDQDQTVPRVQVRPDGWRCVWVHAGIDWERSFEIGLISRADYDARDISPEYGRRFTRAELKKMTGQ